MKAGLVLTTINSCGDLLKAYYENFRYYSHLSDVTVYVVADEKTPTSVLQAECQSLTSKGMDTRFLTLEEQERFLDKLGAPLNFIQRNSDHRRNVGYLMAYEDACDFIVSFDDDNYPIPGVDFFENHAVVCWGVTKDCPVHNDVWFNPCELLDTGDVVLYPRGFPYFARATRNSAPSEYADVVIRINEGLWKGAPDVDAMSWLAYNQQSHGWLRDAHEDAVLGRKSWAPINSQNTAIHRDLVPAYYFVRSGHMGDIPQGYFVQAVAKAMGWSVRFGTPMVEHRRNSHNHLSDLKKDVDDIILLERLLSELVEWKLQSSTVSDLYLDLAERLLQFGVFGMPEDMITWTKLCKQIGASV